MLPKSTQHKNPYAGWSTLNKQDALQSVSNGLRKYRTNRPALKLKSHRYPEQDGVTHWKIRSSGKSLTRAMNGMRQDPISGVVLWEEECYCSPPLSMERTAVLDKYFAEIQVEQLSEGEGWARISDLPVLWQDIHKL